MGFVSFPESNMDSEVHGQTIYNKMYSAASNMIHSFLHDETSADASNPKYKRSNSIRSKRKASTSGSFSDAASTRSTVVQPSPRQQLHSRKHSYNTVSSVPGDSDISQSDHKNIGNAASNSTTANDTGITTSTNSTNTSARPQLLRTSTPSSATVGLSSEQAVPLLPSAAPPSLKLDTQFYPNTSQHRRLSTSSVSSSTNSIRQLSPSGQRPVDVESLLSVNSSSASRAYLASQYSRTRSRATPGRLSREFWMKDESATTCFRCNSVFTTFRRKHHCRVCGQIFCSACTTLIDGERCGAPSHRRVRCCLTCEEALASQSSSDDEGDMSYQSHAPDDSVRWPETTAPTISEEPSSSHDLGYQHHNQHHPFNSLLPGNILSLDYDDDDSGRSESYSRLPSPKVMEDVHLARSFLGTSHNSHISRSRSRSLSRSRSQSQFLRDEDSVSLSRPTRSGSQGASSAPNGSFGETTDNTSNKNNATTNSAAAVGISSNATNSLISNLGSFGGALAAYSSTANPAGSAVGTGPQSTLSTSGYTTAANLQAGGSDEFPLSSAKFPNSASVELNNASLTYLQLFLEKLLKDSELDPEEWKSVLTAPLLEVAAGLHLELNDKLSPREWVKVKRILGGTAHDVDCINGTVFTHSLARKGMAQQLRHPRILLIAFPIEYARNERYMSLEPVVAQELEFLRKLVARITVLKPTLILTCSHICGRAMDMLEAAGISVAQHVRESALFRLSKITKADILMSIDRLSTSPQLGSCELFSQRMYRHENFVKTYLFFFVRNEDPGRCALVRGEEEISRIIKLVLEVMAEICYSLKAETALMRDQFVLVPALTNPPAMILSSSPFVDYGMPYLQMQTEILKGEVEQLNEQLAAVEAATESNAVAGIEANEKAEAQEAEEEAEATAPVSVTSPEPEASVTGAATGTTSVVAAAAPEDQKYVLSCREDSVRRKYEETSQTWDAIEMSFPFMFNPSSHQNIVVLYSLVSSETATPCVGPESQLIEFYLNTDQTLGKFVESSIAQVNVACPECGRQICDHYRTYVNGNGMITVRTEKMPCKVPGLEDSILMWSYCKKCDEQMPVVPMSSTTWKCSMGKYLELSFYGEPLKMRASSCQHNVYRDHVRYFGWHGWALRIEYSTVELNEIYGPPKLLTWNPENEVQLKHKAYNEWCQKLDRFWNSLYDSLVKVKLEGLDDKMLERSKMRLEEMKAKVKTDRQEVKRQLDQIYEETPAYDYISLNAFLEGYQVVVDEWHADLADFDGQFFPTEKDIRRVTAQHIRGLLGDEAPEKPKSIRRRSSVLAEAPRSEKLAAEDEKSVPLPNSAAPIATEPQAASSEPATVPATAESATATPTNSGSESGASKTDAPIDYGSPVEPTTSSATPVSSPSAHAASPAAKSVPAQKSDMADLVRSKNSELSDLNEAMNSSNELDQPPVTASPPVKVKSKAGNDINVLMPGFNAAGFKEGGGRVAFLARHFEELSREFEKERLKEKQRLKERQRAIQMRHAHPVAEVFEDVSEAVEDWPQLGATQPNTTQQQPQQPQQQRRGQHARSQSQPSGAPLHSELDTSSNRAESVPPKESTPVKPSSGDNTDAEMEAEAAAEALTHIPATNEPEVGQAVAEVAKNAVATAHSPAAEADEEELKKAEPVKISLIRTLANFWAERSSARWNGVKFLLDPQEHYFTNSPVVLREDEPSSLIAFCLSLPDYQSRVSAFYSRAAENQQANTSDHDPEQQEQQPPNYGSEATGSNNPLNYNDSILEQAMLRQTGTHMRYHFDRHQVKVSCKIFYSEQFDALRRKCMVPDKFIQSLSRCSTWDSTGGKSGSAFLKTLDDRLILKELSHAEFDSLITFAPSYFEYMSQALFHELPTFLAKLFGVYQITMRNSQNSQQIKMYVLVMENLFYGASFSKFFDLKGSMRNRKVTETGRANEVLLDENMVEYIYESPVFVREHSKRMLRASLYNDTLFLTKMNVMDYSLVIGLDEEKNVIVAGIIDYIRTYTWDKKIESWVKTRAATVGIKEPTVVSPKQYKGRFRESMERYFVMVPDCWSQPAN